MRWHWQNVPDWPKVLHLSCLMLPTIGMTVVWLVMCGWPKWQALQQYKAKQHTIQQRQAQLRRLRQRIRIQQAQLKKMKWLPAWRVEDMRHYFQHFAHQHQFKWQQLEHNADTWELSGIVSYGVVSALQHSLMRLSLNWQWQSVHLQAAKKPGYLRFQAVLLTKLGKGDTALNWPKHFVPATSEHDPFYHLAMPEAHLGFIQFDHQRYIAAHQQGKWQLRLQQRGHG